MSVQLESFYSSQLISLSLSFSSLRRTQSCSPENPFRTSVSLFRMIRMQAYAPFLHCIFSIFMLASSQYWMIDSCNFLSTDVHNGDDDVLFSSSSTLWLLSPSFLCKTSLLWMSERKIIFSLPAFLASLNILSQLLSSKWGKGWEKNEWSLI